MTANPTTSHPAPPLAETVMRRAGSPRIEQVEVGGETVVYDCEASALHLLDPLATVVWSVLDGTVTLRQASEEIAAAFEENPAEVLVQVQEFARQLEMVSLVHRVEQG